MDIVLIVGFFGCGFGMYLVNYLKFYKNVFF